MCIGRLYALYIEDKNRFGRHDHQVQTKQKRFSQLLRFITTSTMACGLVTNRHIQAPLLFPLLHVLILYF